MTQRCVWTLASLHVNVTASVTLTDTLIQQDLWTQSSPQIRTANVFPIRSSQVDLQVEITALHSHAVPQAHFPAKEQIQAATKCSVTAEYWLAPVALRL